MTESNIKEHIHGFRVPKFYTVFAYYIHSQSIGLLGVMTEDDQNAVQCDWTPNHRAAKWGFKPHSYA